MQQATQPTSIAGRLSHFGFHEKHISRAVERLEGEQGELLGAMLSGCPGGLDEPPTQHGRLAICSPSRMLTIRGINGSGKTQLACDYCAALLHAGRKFSAIYTTARKLTRDAREAEHEGKALAAWIDTDILIVDEMGKGTLSAYYWGTFEELVDERYARDGKRTLFLSNAAWWDGAPEAIRDRLREIGQRIMMPDRRWRREGCQD